MVEVAIPTLPFLSTIKAVDVANVAVDVETARRFAVPAAAPPTERRLHGVVVPMPI